jgi:hypothetical protein
MSSASIHSTPSTNPSPTLSNPYDRSASPSGALGAPHFSNGVHGRSMSLSTPNLGSAPFVGSTSSLPIRRTESRPAPISLQGNESTLSMGQDAFLSQPVLARRPPPPPPSPLSRIGSSTSGLRPSLVKDPRSLSSMGLSLVALTLSMSLGRSSQPLCGAILDDKWLLIG